MIKWFGGMMDWNCQAPTVSSFSIVVQTFAVATLALSEGYNAFNQIAGHSPVILE